MSIEVITLGCRLNEYESQIMKDHSKKAGLNDAVIVNTCAVTNEAVRQAKQKIRKLKRDNPNKQIIVTGCAVQVDPISFSNMSEVDLVIGNHEKTQEETFHHIQKGDLERVRVNDIMEVKETASHMVQAFHEKTRAYVQVQNGCDHRCTFCIIPYGRGNSRSVGAGEVIQQIKILTQQGYKEVVLTGVDITSWGNDLPNNPKLGDLVEKILKLIPDLPRLRLSSIDSVEIDPKLIDIIIHEKRFMPHLHLSLQAGDNMILKRMKRRHLREDAIKICTDIKALRPEIVIGADLIAGFPTENEEMFLNTAKIIEEIGIIYCHIFPYSAKQGTPAAKMPQVEKSIIKQRASILRDIGKKQYVNYLHSLIGIEETILLENNSMGRTARFTPVKLKTPMQNLTPGTFITTKIIAHDNQSLIGQIQ